VSTLLVKNALESVCAFCTCSAQFESAPVRDRELDASATKVTAQIERDSSA